MKLYLTVIHMNEQYCGEPEWFEWTAEEYPSEAEQQRRAVAHLIDSGMVDDEKEAKEAIVEFWTHAIHRVGLYTVKLVLEED